MHRGQERPRASRRGQAEGLAAPDYDSHAGTAAANPHGKSAKAGEPMDVGNPNGMVQRRCIKGRSGSYGKAPGCGSRFGALNANPVTGTKQRRRSD